MYWQAKQDTTFGFHHSSDTKIEFIGTRLRYFANCAIYLLYIALAILNIAIPNGFSILSYYMFWLDTSYNQKLTIFDATSYVSSRYTTIYLLTLI